MAEEAGAAEAGESTEAAEATEQTQQAPAEAQAEAPKEKPAEKATEAKPKAEKKAEAKTAEADWRDFVTDKKFKEQATRFESVDAVFRSLEDMRRHDRIKVPGEDSSDEDRAKFKKAIGVPESADDYKVEVPEGVEFSDADNALIEALKPIAHDANVPASAFQEFALKFKEFEAQVLNEDQAAKERAVEEAQDALRKEWGKDYDGNVNIANRTMGQLAESIGGELMNTIRTAEMKDGRFLGDHPDMVRLFAHLGRRMSEDGVMAPVSHDEMSDLASQHAELTAKAHEAQASGDRISAEKFFAQRAAISARMEGDAPIVGGGGRST